MLKGPNRKIIIFDQTIIKINFEVLKLKKTLSAFVKESEIIIANRLDKRVRY